jgi:hypothetical protein
VTGPDLATVACEIVDTNMYATLGTADAAGVPWATPVYFAPDGYRSYLWVSDPEARHSRNLAERPEMSLVVFDSRAPIGTGVGFYAAGVAAEVPDADLDRCLRVYSRTAQAHGGRAWARADVTGTARHRLYRAVVAEQWTLDARDRRVAVTLPEA